MADRGLSIDGLEKWQKWLLNSAGAEGKETKGRILRTAGLRTLEHLDDYTPVRTGRLKGSMSMGGKDNVFQLKVGGTSFVFVGTAVNYALHVNDGFTQLAGQFVPGFWKSGTFHYDPNANSGMVLTGKVVEGAHMFEKALDDMEKDVPRILEYEFRRLYMKLF